MTDSSFSVEESFRFLGRTFEEYRHLFGLDPSSLPERVLDCPGGPSSFTAVINASGTEGYAVDPQYGSSVDDLAAVCERAIERTTAQLHEKRDLFVWDFYGDVETRARYLRAAAERFLADYANHRGRYVEAALPALPVRTDAVAYVLSANFLFLYDDRLDLDFHRAAVTELARVASDQVRLFPLASLDAERSDYVVPVVEYLRSEGHSVEFQAVPYEFQPGVSEMLVVSV